MRCANQVCTTVRSPSRNTPSAGLERMRWQVSRLAEQGLFPFDPRLPDLQGVSGLGHLSGHGRGGGCF